MAVAAFCTMIARAGLPGGDLTESVNPQRLDHLVDPGDPRHQDANAGRLECRHRPAAHPITMAGK